MEGQSDGRTAAARARGAACGGDVAADVLITARAYASILAEVLDKPAPETGGLLLGCGDDGRWVVAEASGPGTHPTLRPDFFAYDRAYEAHVAARLSGLCERPLEVLGFWHRHPGSLDWFSAEDGFVNERFAALRPDGCLSMLVNVDLEPRLTVFGVDAAGECSVLGHGMAEPWEDRLLAPYAAADGLARAVARSEERAREDALRGEAWEEAVVVESSGARPHPAFAMAALALLLASVLATTRLAGAPQAEARVFASSAEAIEAVHP